MKKLDAFLYRGEQLREKYATLFYQFKTGYDQSVEDQLNLADLQAAIGKRLESLPEKCRRNDLIVGGVVDGTTGWLMEMFEK